MGGGEPSAPELLARVEGIERSMDVAIDPDDAELAALEAKAAATNDVTPDLLQALHAAGLLDRHADPSSVRAHLAADPALSEYYRAAHAMHEYLRSTERREALGEMGRDDPLLASVISIDWFRKGPYTYPGFSPTEWLALLEARRREDPLAEPPEGESLSSDGVIAYTALHRRDNGVSVALVRAGERCLPDGA